MSLVLNSLHHAMSLAFLMDFICTLWTSKLAVTRCSRREQSMKKFNFVLSIEFSLKLFRAQGPGSIWIMDRYCNIILFCPLSLENLNG